MEIEIDKKSGSYMKNRFVFVHDDTLRYKLMKMSEVYNTYPSDYIRKLIERDFELYIDNKPEQINVNFSQNRNLEKRNNLLNYINM